MEMTLESILTVSAVLIKFMILVAVCHVYVLCYLNKKNVLNLTVKRFYHILFIMILPFPVMLIENYVFPFFVIGFCYAMKELLVNMDFRVKLFSLHSAYATPRFTGLLACSPFVAVYVTVTAAINPTVGAILVLYSLLALVLTFVQDAITRH